MSGFIMGDLKEIERNIDMKKSLFFTVVAFALLLASCSDNASWEYKVVKIEPQMTLGERANNMAGKLVGDQFYNSRMPHEFESPTYKLNNLGEEGWELVSVYTTIETVFPNFGDAEYHIGIKTNSRTESINFVFKRKI